MAQGSLPANVSLCADLVMEVVAMPKGRDLMTVTLRVRNQGPGDYAGSRGAQWVEHVVTIAGKEVERKKHAFVTIASGGQREFSFTRAKSGGDFGVWAAIMHAEGSGQTGDCNGANDAAVKAFSF
ncbi:MAG: hypothetical protein ACK40I_06955 [Tabrizicola sp.]